MKSNRKNKKLNDSLNNQDEAAKDKYKLPENGFEIKVEPLQVSFGLVEKTEITEQIEENAKNENLDAQLEEMSTELSESINENSEAAEAILNEGEESLNEFEETPNDSEVDPTELEEEVSKIVDNINPSRVNAVEETDTSNILIDEDTDEVAQKEKKFELDTDLELNEVAEEAIETTEIEGNNQDSVEVSPENTPIRYEPESDAEVTSQPELFLAEDRKIDIKKSTKSALTKVKAGSKNIVEKLKTNWQKRKSEKAKFEAGLSATEKEKIQKRKAAGTLILFATIIAIVTNIVWAKIPVESLNLSRYNLNGVFFKSLLEFLLAMLIPSVVVFKLFSLKQTEVLGKTKQNSTAYILTALMGIPLALVITGLHNVTIFILDKLGVSVTFKNHFAINQSPSILGFILMLSVLVLIPAIVEEFMFRGVLQASLRNPERLQLSLLLTATASSLFFKNIMFVVVYLAISLVLSLVKEAADNLLIPILLHISISTSLLLMQYFLPLYSSAIELKSIDGRSKFYTTLILAVVAIVLLIPLFKASFSAYDDSRDDKYDEESEMDNYIELQNEIAPVDWQFVLATLLLLLSSAMV